MQSKYLPPNPSLEHLKSQAKNLHKAYQQGEADAFDRIRSFYPKLQDATDAAIQQAPFSLQEAQMVIACECSFDSWTKLNLRFGSVGTYMGF